MNRDSKRAKSSNNILYIKKDKKENIEISADRLLANKNSQKPRANKFLNKSTKYYRLENRNFIEINQQNEFLYSNINRKSLLINRCENIKNSKEEFFQIKFFDCISDVERQSLNAINQYGYDIDKNLKILEKNNSLEAPLSRHEIMPELRAKMVDWMVEVMTNFECNKEAFFLSVNLMDIYCKNSTQNLISADIHLIGVTSMYIASKFEDIYPLKIKTVYEKIGHKKLTIEQIKACESQIMNALGFFIQVPSALDFIKIYLKLILKLFDYSQQELISKLTIYLAKMNLHDYNFCSIKPSLQAVGSIVASFKLYEELKKSKLFDHQIMIKLVKMSGYKEDQIIKCYKKILYNCHNFETIFQGLENLKKKNYYDLKRYL